MEAEETQGNRSRPGPRHVLGRPSEGGAREIWLATVYEDLRYIWSFELQIIGSDGWTYEDQTTLMNMVVEGKLKPVIHSTRPLSETPQALQELIDRKVFGKSILIVTE